MSTFVLKRKNFALLSAIGKGVGTFMKNNPNIASNVEKSAGSIMKFAKENPKLMKTAGIATSGAAVYGGMKLGEKLKPKDNSAENQ